MEGIAGEHEGCLFELLKGASLWFWSIEYGNGTFHRCKRFNKGQKVFEDRDMEEMHNIVPQPCENCNQTANEHSSFQIVSK